MAKRKSATAESAGGATTARTQRRAARVEQDALPGLSLSEAPVKTRVKSQVKAPARPAQVVALRVAPTNGPRQPARQEPAATPAPAPTTTPDATGANAAMDSAATHATPKRPRKMMSSRRFGDLRAALAEGWEIVQPIFARPLWSAADDSQTAFNFVLRRDQATRLLTIPDSRTVERFITTHSLTVDYRR
jgi:hypothetical protein